MYGPSQRRRLGLCLLCGLPGAGKSTLALSLSSGGLGQPTAVITYDDIITSFAFPEELHIELDTSRDISSPSKESNEEKTGDRMNQMSLWKQNRHHLLQYLEHLIVALLNGSLLVAPADRIQGSWDRFVHCLEHQGLISPAESDMESLYLSIPENQSLYLLLDDNFYYQSMRYEMYQLARKYALGFCQLYLHCPVECCLLRNKKRPYPVLDETIWLMEKKIEKPNPEKNTWEQNSLILDSSGQFRIDEITELLNQALENPLRPLQEDREEKDKDRAICATNIFHQADQSLRRLISETMVSVKGAVSGLEMKAVAKELQCMKSKLLQDLRESTSCLQPVNKHSVTSIIALFKEQSEHIVKPYLSKEQRHSETDCFTAPGFS
ncbi:L-seryl-tRNA(Sec) kinase [Rhinophrynus dorsalis]